jgi:pimeloyl-ACP methyl ester carboxylesterase
MVDVPLDYRNPSGQQISVAVSMIPAANPSARRGVLFLNPGGPGGNQALDLPRIFTYLFSGTSAQAVLDEYDLIGFDPRGNNHSTPVTCGLTSQQTAQALPPLEQNHSFDATEAFVQTVAAGCANNSGALLPFITTANTARDMDLIRNGLGEDKLNYFAWSYGSYLGAVYATLYPNNTDRVVIDSNVDPNWIWRTQFRNWGLGGQTRWPDFANWAAANDATYHFGSTPDQVTALYSQLLAKADANPFQDANFFDDGTLINGPMFRALTFAFLANDREFVDVAVLWQDTQNAAGGTSAVTRSTINNSAPALSIPVVAKPSAAAVNAGAPTVNPGPPPVLPRDIQAPLDNSVVSGLAVLCDDVQWSRTPLQYQTELDQDSQSYPLFGPYPSNIWECAFWPNAPIEPPVQITANGPANILMLQNLRDPNTPYSGAQEMHSALGQRSRLVTIDGGGHAVYGLEPNSVCAATIATDYLANGVFPAGDLFCPANSSTPTTAATDAQSAGKDRVRKALLRQMLLGDHVLK